MTVARRELEATELGLLIPEVPAMVVGDFDDGIEYTCPNCQTVLATRVHERQILDITVRCPSCSEISAFPRRVSGEPVLSRSVLIRAGAFRVTEPIKSRQVPMVGGAAVAGYVTETGADYGDRAESIDDRPLDVVLHGLIGDGKALLGDRFEALASQYDRGERSATPPKQRHRLVELIRWAESVLSAWGSLDSVLDAAKFEELRTAVHLVNRWGAHPAFPSLVDGLVDAGEVGHTIMTLAVASMLVDTGNGVGLTTSSAGKGRRADAWVQASLRERLNVEVKAPVSLRSPSTAPNKVTAVRLVKRLVNGASDQLGADETGLLAIGGTNLPPESLSRLEEASVEVLRRERDRKGHVAGVILLGLHAVADVTSDGGARLAFWA